MRVAFLKSLQFSKKKLLAITTLVIILVYNVITTFNYLAFGSIRRQFQSVSFNILRANERYIAGLNNDSPEGVIIRDWHQLALINEPSDFFTYSAYRDDRNKVIRIVAVTPSYSKRRLFCYLYTAQNSLVVVPATIQSGNTFIDTKYSSAWILCPVNEEEKVDFVSISDSPDAGPFLFQKLPVQEADKSGIYKHKFGVCVQPIFAANAALDFIQWVEFHTLMGTSSFTLYNISIGPDLSCVIEEYGKIRSQLEITVLPWTVPFHGNDDILHINGQYAQANDCAMRSRGIVEHLLMIDLDEYLVPNVEVAENYTRLMGEVKKRTENTVVQYGFGNVVFPRQCNNNPRSESNSLTISNFRELKLFQNHKGLKLEFRTMKFITTPEKVLEPGIHVLATPIDHSYREVEVEPDLGFLHHFKGREIKSCSELLEYRREELLAERLYPRVQEMVEKLGKVCNIH